MTQQAGYGSGFALGSLVGCYSDLLVPRLFAPWAERLLDRVDPAPGSALLDVACGPGTVARAAARRVGSNGRVIGVDLSEAMIAVAREHVADEEGLALIEYRVCPAERLSVEDASVDAVTCQQGLQFFPDPRAALAEVRRVLRPRGRLGVACWSSIERCTPFAALQRALAAVLPAERVALVSGPFRWPGAAALHDALDAAGFRDVEVDEETMPIVFELGVRQWLGIAGAMPIGEDLAALSTEGRAALEDAGERETANMRKPSGEIRGDMTSIVATARA